MKLGAADESIQQAIELLAVEGRVSDDYFPFFGRPFDKTIIPKKLLL